VSPFEEAHFALIARRVADAQKAFLKADETTDMVEKCTQTTMAHHHVNVAMDHVRDLQRLHKILGRMEEAGDECNGDGKRSGPDGGKGEREDGSLDLVHGGAGTDHP
jgi:hypothetical protein